ncbi:hypothetical protein AAG570_012753 [Ranatra chinensis]|uniref:Uncharacterized protein n=1 Tax=Ranatra chinensis TaxID=642074 RepID=A0ABD0Z314_9HEMI
MVGTPAGTVEQCEDGNPGGRGSGSGIISRTYRGQDHERQKDQRHEDHRRVINGSDRQNHSGLRYNGNCVGPAKVHDICRRLTPEGHRRGQSQWKSMQRLLHGAGGAEV